MLWRFRRRRGRTRQWRDLVRLCCMKPLRRSRPYHPPNLRQPGRIADCSAAAARRGHSEHRRLANRSAARLNYPPGRWRALRPHPLARVSSPPCSQSQRICVRLQGRHRGGASPGPDRKPLWRSAAQKPPARHWPQQAFAPVRHNSPANLLVGQQRLSSRLPACACRLRRRQSGYAGCPSRRWWHARSIPPTSEGGRAFPLPRRGFPRPASSSRLRIARSYTRS